MRARIESLGYNSVAAAWDAADGDGRVEAEYWAPWDGGYVRGITPRRPGTLGLQVCNALAHSGDTLRWAPKDGPMVDLIRREYRRMRRQEARHGW